MTTILVAHSENRTIGKNNKLLWNLPEDLALFKNRTIGHAVIMGRKTFDSLPKSVRPLQGRMNIVLSNTKQEIKDVIFTTCPEEAIKIAKDAKKHPFIIGGEQIYNLYLEKYPHLVDRIIASVVKGKFDGDTHFPEIPPIWHGKIISRFIDFYVVDYQKFNDVRNERDKLLVSLKELNEKYDLLLERYKIVKQYAKNWHNQLQSDRIVENKPNEQS